MIAIVGSRTVSAERAKAWLTEHARLIPASGVVTGCADGADRAGREWARENDVPLKVFVADWTKHGKAAGMLRNTLIVEECQSVIAFWDGESRGTLDTIRKAVKAGKVVRIVPASSL